MREDAADVSSLRERASHRQTDRERERERDRERSGLARNQNHDNPCIARNVFLFAQGRSPVSSERVTGNQRTLAFVWPHCG